MTERQRIARAVAENFERHVRATAEIAGVLIVRAVTGRAARAEDLAVEIDTCEQAHRRLVYEEAMRRLGIGTGRPRRRKASAAGGPL
jgi:hypothetical protein